MIALLGSVLIAALATVLGACVTPAAADTIGIEVTVPDTAGTTTGSDPSTQGTRAAPTTPPLTTGHDTGTAPTTVRAGGLDGQQNPGGTARTTVTAVPDRDGGLGTSGTSGAAGPAAVDGSGNGAADGSGTATVAGGGLASTGVPATRMLMIGLAMVAIGAALAGAAARRQTSRA